MSKPILYSQERMDDDLIPKVKEEKRKFASFKEFFESPDVSNQRKLDLVGQFSQFVTLNSLTKADLHAALKWLFDQGYEFVDVDQPPNLKLIRGKDDCRSAKDVLPQGSGGCITAGGEGNTEKQILPQGGGGCRSGD